MIAVLFHFMRKLLQLVQLIPQVFIITAFNPLNVVEISGFSGTMRSFQLVIVVTVCDAIPLYTVSRKLFDLRYLQTGMTGCAGHLRVFFLCFSVCVLCSLQCLEFVF